MAQCRGCKADIRWIKSSKGKSMPLDIEIFDLKLDPNGDILAVNSKGETVRGFRVTDPNEKNYIRVSTSHFTTCPMAKDFSRG